MGRHWGTNRDHQQARPELLALLLLFYANRLTGFGRVAFRNTTSCSGNNMEETYLAAMW